MRVSSAAVLLLGLFVHACASGGSGDAAAPADDQAVDCSALDPCSDKLECAGGAQCFKLKSCENFVCTDVKAACKAECGPADCMVLESQPMLLSCR